MELTIRQARFVEEYLVCGSGAEAARRAGYRPRAARQQASRLLTKANIRGEIDRKRAEIAEVATLQLADVIDGLLDAVEQAKLRADAGTQIAAWREIAKILGYYPETTKSSRKSNIDPNDIQTWPDEMLRDYLVK